MVGGPGGAGGDAGRHLRHPHRPPPISRLGRPIGRPPTPGKGVEVIDTASFYVAASLGPLDDGEYERARRWGRSLGERLQVTIGGPVAASRR